MGRSSRKKKEQRELSEKEKLAQEKPWLDAQGRPLPPMMCPQCRYQMDCASCLFDKAARPKPGDLTVCMACGAAGQFGQNMYLEPVPDEVLQAMTPEEKLQLFKLKLARARVVPPNFPFKKAPIQ